MASIRRGYSDDFTLKNNNVGIGTSTGQEALDVVDGAVKGQDLKVTGISSFTAYEGFLRADQQIAENTTLSSDQGPVSSLSGEIIVGTGQTVTVSKVEDEFANANNGTVWSTYLSNSAGGFQDAYPASNAFNGKISATETSRSVNSQITSTWTPPEGITYSTSVEVWTYYAGSVSLNGGAAITVNNDQSWRKIGSGSGTLTSITFSSNSGNDVYIAGIAIDGEILVDGFSTLVDKGARAGGSEVECLKVFNTFTPPSGGTNERPYAPKPGELYYNYDFKTIEFFDGYGWRQVDNTTRSGRAAFGGGSPSTNANTIQYINIHTTGNSSYFGDLTRTAGANAGFASATRGISGGGAPGTVNIIDYITIASAGNAINFGDLTVGRTDHGGCSSSTRGLWGGGYNPSPSPAKQSVNVIDYVEIATLGDALDFGDLTVKPYTNSGCASPTRGIFTGGFAYTAPSPGSRVPEFNSVTIASKGNALDFGDPLNDYNGKASCSNSVKGVHAGGNNPGSTSEMGSFIIASFGSFTNFGDLSRKRSTSTGVSTKTRGVFAGGVESFPTRINTIDYITFSSAGSAIDFGELIRASSEPSGMSDSHGGLGGF